MRFLFTMFLAVLFHETLFAKIGLQQNSQLNRYYYREYRGFDPENLIFGGNLGMDFIREKDSIYKTSESGYSIFVTPTIGYRFGRVQAGFNGGYSFTHVNIRYINFITKGEERYLLNSSNYSLSLFARLLLHLLSDVKSIDVSTAQCNDANVRTVLEIREWCVESLEQLLDRKSIDRVQFARLIEDARKSLSDVRYEPVSDAERRMLFQAMSPEIGSGIGNEIVQKFVH